MEVEQIDNGVDEELHSVLFTGRQYTQPGSVLGNCLLLFGSNEGKCEICTKPCLHPLSTNDLSLFFHNDGIIMFDWIDDTACIVVCKDASVVADIFNNYFQLVSRTEESGIEWYKSKDRVLKQSETDLYGEQGKEIHIYARCCLTSDVEHKQKLHQAKIVTNIIKKRRALKRKMEKEALKKELKDSNPKKKKKKKKRKNKAKTTQTNDA